MQLTNKRIFLISMVILLAMLALLPGAALADNDPTAEPVVSTIADKLIIQLGPEWAGTEFSLTTDMGVYPGVITVNEVGILTMELGESGSYTLRCIGTLPAAPGEMDETGHTLEPASTGESQTFTSTEPVQAPLQAEPAETAVELEAPVSEEERGIPTMHKILFFGGLLLGITGLIVMRIMKSRREYQEYDDE